MIAEFLAEQVTGPDQRADTAISPVTAVVFIIAKRTP
jgi:hypothetical protein